MASERDHFVDSLLEDVEIQDPTGKTIPMHVAHGAPLPPEVKNEQPWHRTLAYLLLQGRSSISCAQELGKTPVMVSLVKRQPWFRELLTELSQDSFESDFMSLLAGSAKSAVLTLDALLESDDERVQASAASKLADMYVRNRPPEVPDRIEDPKEELRQLEEQKLRLEAEAKVGERQEE